MRYNRALIQFMRAKGAVVFSNRFYLNTIDYIVDRYPPNDFEYFSTK